VTFNNEYAQLCITDVDDGTVIVITSPMAEAALKGAQPIQLMGSIQTYQRRYLWMAAMELTEHDTIDMTPAPEPKQAPKPVATQTPAPAEKPAQKPVKQRPDPIPPQHVEPDAWTIVIDAPESSETWVDMMVAANSLKVSMATSADQLKQMFQVNKPLYDKLKTLNPSVYADVIDNFSAAKKSFF
jgi:cell division septation protein DedD